MQESTATIKLTKSEIDWTIIALVYSQQAAEHFSQWDDANMYERIRKDFTKISNDIIEGEKNLEAENKNEEENRTGRKACEECSD